VLTIEQLEATRRKAIADAQKTAQEKAERDAKNTNLAKFWSTWKAVSMPNSVNSWPTPCLPKAVPIPAVLIFKALTSVMSRLAQT
jgi:hypothetical protein